MRERTLAIIKRSAIDPKVYGWVDNPLASEEAIFAGALGIVQDEVYMFHLRRLGLNGQTLNHRWVSEQGGTQVKLVQIID